MTRIHVVTGDNGHLYGDELQQYFRLRHDIFVEERGWKDLHRPDGLEIDRYDNEHAVYLLAIDRERVVGGQRDQGKANRTDRLPASGRHPGILPRRGHLRTHRRG
jgi:hypothetical protein